MSSILLRNILLCLLLGLALVACAQEKQQRLYALPFVEVPAAKTTPLMTADLADPAWATAAVIPALGGTIKDRVPMKPFPTEVRLLWDAKYLYVRFICTDAEIYSPFEKHDDPLYLGDVVEMFLDARGDARQYIELQVSPRNKTFDQNFVLSAEPRADVGSRLPDEILQRDFWSNLQWDMAGLRTATSTITKNGVTTGWVADIAVPAEEALHRLGEKTFHPMTLRAHFMRYEWPKPAKDGDKRQLIGMSWSPIVDGCPHISPMAMGFVVLQDSPAGN